MMEIDEQIKGASRPALLTAVEKVLEVLDGWEPPDPCNLEIDPCLDCLMINEMRRAIEGASK